MARKQRDYRAEYQRRVARERERAAREGRNYSSHRARGHVSPQHERTQRAKYRAAKRLTLDLLLQRKLAAQLAWAEGDDVQGPSLWANVDRLRWPHDPHGNAHDDPLLPYMTDLDNALPLWLFYYHDLGKSW